jgi:hypothetical protein
MPYCGRSRHFLLGYFADPDPDSIGSVARIRNEEISCFLSAGCSLLRAEGFFCTVTWMFFMEA